MSTDGYTTWNPNQIFFYKHSFSVGIFFFFLLFPYLLKFKKSWNMTFFFTLLFLFLWNVELEITLDKREKKN